MKKVVIIFIIILIIAAALAVFAIQTDLFKSDEIKKPSVEHSENELKFPAKTIKMPKLKIIDKDTLNKNLKKFKEQRDKDPGFKKEESCGK